MATNTCIHIVPALPPQIDDVGGYALNLALRLRQSHGIESRFIVCDPQWNGPSRVEGFVVRRLRLRTEAGIWSLLATAKEKDSAVLLHYSGYGYDNLGVPIWLYLGINSWLGEQTGRSTASQKQFCTVFHESLESCAKPWKIEFYLRNLQKSLLRRFHHRSKVSVTRTRRMHQMLEAFEPHKTLWLPTPSNVPVSDRSNCARRRNGSLRTVILGRPDSRAATVKAHANLLRTLEVKGRIASAMLLSTGNDTTGAPTEDVGLLRQCISPERIGVLGQLNPADVSRHLAEADLFLSHYNGETAPESSAFMAALAARCPAVLRDGENTVSLQEREHFIASDDSHASVWRFEQIIADGRLDQIAMAGQLWYERYGDWNVIARKYHEAICHQATFDGECLIYRERPNALETPLHAAGERVRQAV
jgi:hypothetical protein